MTILENKYSYSENNCFKKNSLSFNKLQTSMQYILLNELDGLCAAFPSSGYINILCYDRILPFSYSINDELFFIEQNENSFHQVQEKQTLRVTGRVGIGKSIVIFLPEFSLPDTMLPKQQTTVLDNSRLKLLKQRVAELHQTDHLSKHIRIQSLLLDALAIQIESMNVAPEVTIQSDLLEKILQAQKLIDQDLTKNYTINELSKAVGTNEQYLKKYFKQYVGKTIMNYVLETKMLYAKKLITTGDVRIADVARMTGYKHATHFSMNFKKFFGILPTSLRYSLFLLQSSAVELAELDSLRFFL